MAESTTERSGCLLSFTSSFIAIVFTAPGVVDVWILGTSAVGNGVGVDDVGATTEDVILIGGCGLSIGNRAKVWPGGTTRARTTLAFTSHGTGTDDGGGATGAVLEFSLIAGTVVVAAFATGATTVDVTGGIGSLTNTTVVVDTLAACEGIVDGTGSTIAH